MAPAESNGGPRAARRIAVLVVAMLLASCSSGATPTGPSGAGRAVVVASYNFPESELVAEIYAQALTHAGVPVRRQLDLGTREMVLPALHQGLVDVVPEYLGSGLASLDPAAEGMPGIGADEERARLGRVLAGWHVRVLDPAPAQNQNGLAVTSATAGRYHLTATSQLEPVAPRLRLGGPSECPGRLYCMVGLRSVYGLRFGAFVPFDAEGQRVSALDQGVVDVAVMFTTDGALATGRFVLLGDDRHLQPAENIAPLVSDRAVSAYGRRVVDTLDAVSARLTTPGLVFLNWRIGPGSKDVAAEARGWLQRQGLLPRG